MTTVLNATNEVVVQQFLEEKVSFTDIPTRVERVLGQVDKQMFSKTPSLEEIIHIDRWSREKLLQPSY